MVSQQTASGWLVLGLLKEQSSFLGTITGPGARETANDPRVSFVTRPRRIPWALLSLPLPMATSIAIALVLFWAGAMTY